MAPITPPSLLPGDTIALVAPSRKVSEDFILSATAEIQSWGYNVKPGKHLFATDHQFAGSDAQRVADLNDAIRDPEVKAIIAARGGYGATRLLEELDVSAFAKNPKWIVGYSDSTALHHHIFRETGVQTIHGSMAVNFEKNSPEALMSLRHLLSGKTISYEMPVHALNRSGIAEGMMVGGNLSVIFSLLGSASQIDTRGCILFLEDLDEYLYHIDRMMLALQRAGMLTYLAGMMVGGMTDMRDNEVPFGKTAEEIIADHAARFDFPVCFGFPSGHFPNNIAWIHGKKIRLEVNDHQPSSLNHSS